MTDMQERLEANRERIARFREQVERRIEEIRKRQPPRTHHSTVPKTKPPSSIPPRR